MDIDICQKGDALMPRPQKSRRICCYPDYWSFAPDQDTANDTVTMSLDEFETIRSVDYQGKTQEECAHNMNVSRTTVTAIYDSAERSLLRLWSRANASSFRAGIILSITRSPRRAHGKETVL